jgi:alkyl hydroperoxide reductase 1
MKMKITRRRKIMTAGNQYSFLPIRYVPWTTDDPKACGMPIDYNASKEWADKKVVLVSVPGAFTPGCQGQHIPGYIEKLSELRSKGVDIVAVIAQNDAFGT